MQSQTLITNVTRLANKLDDYGLYAEADALTAVVKDIVSQRLAISTLPPPATTPAAAPPATTPSGGGNASYGIGNWMANSRNYIDTSVNNMFGGQQNNYDRLNATVQNVQANISQLGNATLQASLGKIVTQIMTIINDNKPITKPITSSSNLKLLKYAGYTDYAGIDRIFLDLGKLAVQSFKGTNAPVGNQIRTLCFQAKHQIDVSQGTVTPDAPGTAAAPGATPAAPAALGAQAPGSQTALGAQAPGSQDATTWFAKNKYNLPNGLPELVGKAQQWMATNTGKSVSQHMAQNQVHASVIQQVIQQMKNAIA